MIKKVSVIISLLIAMNIFASDKKVLFNTVKEINNIELSDTLLMMFERYYYLIEIDSDSSELISNEIIELAEQNQMKIILGIGYLLKGDAILMQEEYDEALYFYSKAKENFDNDNHTLLSIIALNHLGLGERSATNNDNALDYFNKALELSLNNEFPEYEALAYNYMGSIYLRKTDYAQADNYYKKSLLIRESLHDTSGIAASRVNIAMVKREVGDFEEALQNLAHSQDLYKKIRDRKGEAEVSTQIGSIYFRKNDFNKALENYYDAYNQRIEIGNPDLISKSASNIGTAYKNLSIGDSAIKYYKIALEINQEQNNKYGLAASLNNLGNLYLEVNDLATAMEYYIQSLSIRQEEENFQLASTLKNIGNIYNLISRYDKAIEYYLKAVRIEEKLKDKKRLAYTYDFIGNSYKIQNEYDKSLNYYEKAIQLKKQVGNQKDIAITLNNIGDLYFDKEDYNEAKKYYNLSLNSGKLADDQWRVAQELNNIGNIYQALEQNEKALEIFLQSFELNKSIKNRFGEALVARKIGEIYLWNEDFSKAIPFIERSLNIGMQLNNQVLIRNALYALYEYYRNTENYEKAMLYLYDYYAVQDSMLTELSNKKVYDVQLNYEIEKREEQIDQIEKENEILNIEKQLQAEKLSQKNIAVLSLIVLLVLLLVIIILIFNRNNYRKKVAITLREKIDLIESTNRALKNSEENLKSSNATKDKFFSIIAHDLRSPIGGLMMASEALDTTNDLSDEEKRDYINVMHKSSRQLYALLDNLLLWSRSQTGRISFKPQMVYVKKIFQENVELMGVNIESKNIVVNNRIQDEYECFVDPELLSTIFRNLLSNAIKFTPEKGKITISAKEKKESVDIYISDTGVGMSKKQIDNLYRVDKTSTTNGTNNEIGTGLGLIITEEFIRMNKGDIKVESTENQGTTFILTFPKIKYNA